MQDQGLIVNFESTDGKDIYNPTRPFTDNGKAYIAARVESRDLESDSQIMFFYEDNSQWLVDRSMPVFDLQDPFCTKISDELMLTGVHRSNTKPYVFKTEFYRGKDIKSLKKFAEGPLGMKDIRLLELPDKRILVFTRPQGKIGGKGKIGKFIVNSLGDIANVDMYSAELLDIKLPSDNYWIGSNELHMLDSHTVGVFGHIGHLGQGSKHYYAVAFTYDLINCKASPIKIIAKRDHFPAGEAKRTELADVVFSGGLVMIDKDYAELYVGLSDVNVGWIIIKNPFGKWCNS